ncbi:FtsH protease activity modulator HflK [Desulfurispirillum indicum]|uniref:Protein HflK n=1 Tax=Desulfurispirillum indicum (strain ATCC BAA-1389 / DSM 22839 / S5) TaxID=653733 RepID=E6W187_DESIS|nr:FtsH protease activity modulator HflK [Desulfurispirillum indicum]ADU66507.1 HflK protein [Desulfurispirillum indicum S5]UCZ55840.1 FtsH protease activity modulator HflK [Desulfurispirillum indicum]
MSKFALSKVFSQYNNPWEKHRKSPFGGGGSGPGGGGGGFNPGNFKVNLPKDFKFPGNFDKKVPVILLVVILLAWLSTGILILKPEEQAAILRFGKYDRTLGPGPHITLPYPIERRYVASVTTVQRLEIGFRSAASQRDDRIISVGQESLMLTGDENILDVKVIVQFRIRDIIDYMFEVRDSLQTLQNTAASSVREVMGGESIDNALTVGKFEIQMNIREQLQKALNEYRAGLEILSVELYDVQPPQQVAGAFREVVSAREDRERFINQAQGYRNQILPQARGEAAQIMEAASAYREERILRARGDVARFLAMESEYRLAPAVTRDRLMFDTLQETLPKTKLFLIDSDAGSGVLPYLPLDGVRTPSARN